MRSWALLLFTMAPSAMCQGGMDLGCVLQHCSLQMMRAAVDPTFWRSTRCEMGCNAVYANDTTPEKLEYQNCTTICALTFESEAGDDFLACAMNNDCITFPEIPGECPVPEVEATASLASLSGEWWQHRGKNALWDCYPCQHIHSMFMVNDSDWCAQTTSPRGPVQAPCWNYTYSYDLYVEDGNGGYTTQYFGQTWQLPGDVATGKQVDIYYEYMGSFHNETWFILHATDRYVLLVDCSYMMDWIDVGSIVWVRPDVDLTEEENTEIAAIYAAKLGWDFDDFCYDTHGPENCDDPSPLRGVSSGLSGRHTRQQWHGSGGGGRRTALRRSGLLASASKDVLDAMKALRPSDTQAP